MITIALLSTEVQSNILHIINPGPKEIEKKSSGKKKKKEQKIRGFYQTTRVLFLLIRGCIKAELEIQLPLTRSVSKWQHPFTHAKAERTRKL